MPYMKTISTTNKHRIAEGLPQGTNSKHKIKNRHGSSARAKSSQKQVQDYKNDTYISGCTKWDGIEMRMATTTNRKQWDTTQRFQADQKQTRQ